MNLKVRIITIILVIIVMIIAIINIFNKKEKIIDKNSSLSNDILDSEVKIEQNNKTGEYIVYRENGQEITRVRDKGEAQIYIDNPDYDPKISIKNIEDYYEKIQ